MQNIIIKRSLFSVVRKNNFFHAKHNYLTVLCLGHHTSDENTSRDINCFLIRSTLQHMFEIITLSLYSNDYHKCYA